MFYKWKPDSSDIFLSLIFIQYVGMSGGWASNLQRTHYYNHESSPGPGPDQVDYHLAQRTRTAGLPHSRTTNQPPILYTDSRLNVTGQLGETVKFTCKILHGLGSMYVSWTKFTETSSDPVALSYNNQVFVSDDRISVVTTRHESVLSLEGLNESDEGTYSCHINSDFNNIISFNIRVQVPTVTLLDGFGRVDRSHFYKVGSSLEVVCQIQMSNLPSDWRFLNLTEFVIWEKNEERIRSNPKQFRKRILTEVEGANIVSRLAITQATKEDTGNYSCTVENYRRTTIGLYIVEGELGLGEVPKPKAILNSGMRKSSELLSILFLYLIL